MLFQSERTGSITIITEDEQTATVYVVQRAKQPTIGTGISLLSDVNIYPNPVNDVLYISNAGSCEVIVTDTRGAFVYRAMVVNNGSIPTENWKSGLYFVTLKSENGNTLCKVLKR